MKKTWLNDMDTVNETLRDELKATKIALNKAKKNEDWLHVIRWEERKNVLNMILTDLMVKIEDHR